MNQENLPIIPMIFLVLSSSGLLWLAIQCCLNRHYNSRKQRQARSHQRLVNQILAKKS